MIRKLILSFALVTAAIYADSAHAKKAVKLHTQPVVAAPQEEVVEESPMAAKLVVDSSAQAEAIPVTEPALAATAAPGLASGSATGSGVSEAPGAENQEAIQKKDVTKLPETEIPVMTESKDKKEASSSGMARVLITLTVLAVALGALTFGLKRWAGRRNPRNQNTKIQILTQHALGPKKALMIVQVAGESLLIGVTDQNISMLKTLSLIDDEIPENMPRNFDSALDEYAEDDVPQGRSAKKPSRDRDDFAMRGLGEIRDTVSSRIKNMKNS
jgi:flagellar protein FliO/FliZ